MDLWGALVDGSKKVAKSVERECDRIGDRVTRNVTHDADQISKGFDQGLFNGLLETADVFSPAHQISNGLVDVGLIREDDIALREGVSAGLNFVTGNPLYLKDAFDMLGAMPPMGSQPQPSPALGPERPRDSYAEFIDGGRCISVGQDDFRQRARDGFSSGPPKCGIGKSRNDVDTGFDWTRESEETDRMIDKILNNPNLCFEDMIFMLMRVVMRDGQKQAKGLAKELKTSRKSSQEARDAMTVDINKLRGEVVVATKSKDPAAVAEAQTKLDAAIDARTTFVQDGSESRAETAENLKNIMQKLSEMEQAMSAILNSQHETAMATIRNIR